MKDRLRQLASVHWIGVKFSEQSMSPTIDDQVASCSAITEAIVRLPIILTEKTENGGDEISIRLASAAKG